MRTFSAAVVALLLLVPAAGAQNLITKQHALALFAMSMDQWNRNAHEAVNTGAAKARMMESGVARMEIVYASGALLYVLPTYADSIHTPSSIAVTLAYPPPMSNMYNAQMIASLAQQAETDMAPEFDVVLDTESVGGGVALFFTISARR